MGVRQPHFPHRSGSWSCSHCQNNSHNNKADQNRDNTRDPCRSNGAHTGSRRFKHMAQICQRVLRGVGTLQGGLLACQGHLLDRQHVRWSLQGVGSLHTHAVLRTFARLAEALVVGNHARVTSGMTNGSARQNPTRSACVQVATFWLRNGVDLDVAGCALLLLLEQIECFLGQFVVCSPKSIIQIVDPLTDVFHTLTLVFHRGLCDLHLEVGEP
mmetsp:Transcript_97557/g.264956  ORF Transcript_97557/g.264956 Transcript_97557/m.264956 type:complete len:214 (-) Transcript_97557:260-901(-)